MGIDTRRTFQQLKTRLHRQIVDSIDMSKAGDLGEEEFRKQLKGLANHLASRPENNLQGRDRDLMVQELMDEIYGFGPLQDLMDDPEVSDVLVNGHDTVFIERNGLLERTDVKFAMMPTCCTSSSGSSVRPVAALTKRLRWSTPSCPMARVCMP